MPIDPSTYTGGKHLIEQLEIHNPWWDFDSEFDPAGGVDARRQAYRDAVELLVTDDKQYLAIGGITTAETGGLLEQLIGTVLQPGFQEQYIQDAGLRSDASELIVPPENVLFLPLGASPLYQIQPAAGLEAVIDHFRTHVATPDHHQYLFLKGVDELRRPSRRGSNAGSGWIDSLAGIVEGADDLTVVISVPSSTFFVDRLTSHPAFDTNSTDWGVQSVTHIGFEEYLRLRYRRLEVAPHEQRFDPPAARQAFRAAVETGELDPFVKHARVDDAERVLEPSTLRRELTMFAVGGGRLSTKLARAGIDLSTAQFESLLRNRGEKLLREHQTDIVDNLRNEVTSAADRLYGLKDSPGPMRLAAVIANERPTEPVEFDDICTVLDVDRRTLREQYLRTLRELGLLDGAPAYANKRPRSIGLYHRDPSVLAAFGDFDLRDALRQEPELAPELWHTMAFDHAIRLSEAVNDQHDPKRGVVKHWSSDDGVVDFVLKVDGRPIPMVFTPNHTLADLKRETGTGAYEALHTFLKQTASLEDEDTLTTRQYAKVPKSVVEQRKAIVDDEAYFGTRRGDVAVDGTAPFGVVVTNAREAMEGGITVDDSGPLPILQLPFWTFLRLA